MKRFINFIRNLFTRKEEVAPIILEPKAPLHYKIALGEIGIKEIPGSGNNTRVIEYHQATSLKASQDAVPWCASFVCWCLEQASVASTRSARAKSYLEWGQEVLEPYKGCVVVLQRGKNPAEGHVGFFVKQQDGEVWLLGGNQGDAVTIESYPLNRVLAFREPLSYPQ